jgi:hypothetical protein
MNLLTGMVCFHVHVLNPKIMGSVFLCKWIYSLYTCPFWPSVSYAYGVEYFIFRSGTIEVLDNADNSSASAPGYVSHA